MGKHPSNLAMFGEVVAHVLVLLHEAFPGPIDLHGMGLIYLLNDRLQRVGFEPQADAEFARDAISFLEREGLIRCNRSRLMLDGPEFPQTTLTMEVLASMSRDADLGEPGCYAELLAATASPDRQFPAYDVVSSLFCDVLAHRRHGPGTDTPDDTAAMELP